MKKKTEPPTPYDLTEETLQKAIDLIWGVEDYEHCGDFCLDCIDLSKRMRKEKNDANKTP